MRDFAMVSPKFWLGETGRALRAQGCEAVIVGLYLLTSPHSNMLGLYYLPTELIARETGLGLEGASKGLRSCIEVEFCSFDEAAQMVWVHEMAAWQVGESLAAADKRCAGVRRAYAEQIESPLLARFYERYAQAFHLTESRGIHRGKEAPSKPLPCPSEARDKGKGIRDKNPPNPPRLVSRDAAKSTSEAFDRFWAAWPSGSRKASKGECAKRWARNGFDACADQILAHVAAKKASSDWTKDGGQFVPAPIVYLNQRQWEGATLSGCAESTETDWATASHSAVSAKGEQLGIGAWDRAAFDSGKGEAFPAYKARVTAAMRAAEVSA